MDTAAISQFGSSELLAFETTKKSEIVNTRGTSYAEFRSELAPKYGIVWFHIFSAYFILSIILVISAYFQKTFPNYFWLTIPVGGFLVGYVVAFIHLFMHEAAHYNIAPNKDRNDLLANVFIGLLVGVDVKFLRSMHFRHHRFLGTTKDTEKSYFEAITWRSVIESITGIRVIKVLAHRNKDVKENEDKDAGDEIIKGNKRIFLIAAVLNLLFVMAWFILGYWQVSLIWVAGLGAVFPFFASFRQILEHRREGADPTINYNTVDHGAAHRMFGDGFIGSTMGPAGFNRHLLHHWDPQISYTRLKEVEGFLKDTPLRDELQKSKTTYLKTLLLLLD